MPLVASAFSHYLDESHQLRRDKDVAAAKLAVLQQDLADLQTQVTQATNDLEDIKSRIVEHDGLMSQFSARAAPPPPPAPSQSPVRSRSPGRSRSPARSPPRDSPQAPTVSPLSPPQDRRSRHDRHKKHLPPDEADPSTAIGRRPSKRSCDPETLNDQFTNIIKLEDGWTEIWCNQCNANSRNDRSRRFFDGLAGLTRHVGGMHYRITKSEVLAECGRRVLSDDEAEEIRAGGVVVDHRLGQRVEQSVDATEDGESDGDGLEVKVEEGHGHGVQMKVEGVDDDSGNMDI